MNFDNRLFVDSSVTEPLPPLYKGKLRKFYPGQMIKNSTKGFVPKASGLERLKRSGLRRYIFRYENGKFIYLATRKGQRNGGFNSKPSQTIFTLYLNSPSDNSAYATSTFTLLSGSALTSFYRESLNSFISYNTNNTRWEWSTRESLTAAFVPQAFSDSTSNNLRNSTAANQVGWTYVQNAWTTGTPQLPAIATITPIEWYNNNSVDNLNKWPIKNYNANYNIEDPNTRLHWQSYDFATGSIVPDNRIDGLSDEYLHKCFQGVLLKNYSIVFVEVMWRFRMHKSDIKPAVNNAFYPPTYKNSTWGYWQKIHEFEWWSPKPYLGRTQKGRVYRIGILEADTGVGKYDKVLWAQRTRIITTRYTRGGRTVLE